MSLTTNFKQMTNTNNTKVNNAAADRSLLRTAGLGIATALTPLAVMIGIAAMNVPAAEAYSGTNCTRIGNTVSCYHY